jgi:cytochrome bd-type quinol oxidase subunit 2
MVMMFILYFLGIVIAYLTAVTAQRRHGSVKAWMWLGLIFGPFAWLTVALLPSIRKERTV